MDQKTNPLLPGLIPVTERLPGKLTAFETDYGRGILRLTVDVPLEDNPGVPLDKPARLVLGDTALVPRTELEEARAEVETSAWLIEQQRTILNGVALALKGAPGPLTIHSHHDLAEVAAATVALAAELARGWRQTCMLASTPFPPLLARPDVAALFAQHELPATEAGEVPHE